MKVSIFLYALERGSIITVARFFLVICTLQVTDTLVQVIVCKTGLW